VFSGAAALISTTVNSETDLGVRPSLVEFATSSYFPVLGLRPMNGRWFAAEEDITTARAVAVVSYHAWRTRFGSDPNVVGRTLRLGGAAVTVVGIGPQVYNGALNGVSVDFWLSLSALGPVMGPFVTSMLERPQDHWFLIRARLREGVTVPQAQAAMNGLSAELGVRFAGRDQTRRIAVLPANDVRLHPSLDRTLMPAAALLMTIVGLVLMLVCGNLAILLLLRGAAQHRDVSIRIAMGAGRGRIVRQFLTESLVLSLAGGLVGFLASGWLIGMVSAIDVPVANGLVDFRMDYRVLAFAMTLSILTGLAFGLAPALRAVKTDVTGVIGFVGAARRRVALKIRDGRRAGRPVPGAACRDRSHHPQHDAVGAGRCGLPSRETGLDHDERDAGWVRAAGESPRLHRSRDPHEVVPGVEAVVRMAQPPLGRRPTSTLVIAEYVSPTGTNIAEVPSAPVSSNYFEALGIPIVHGRAFRPQDDETAPAVAVVSEAMARRYWGTSNVVGRRYRHDSAADSWVEIVGVAADVKVSSLTEDPQPMYYRPWEQQGFGAVSFIVRTGGDPRNMVGTLGRIVREVDPALPILQASTLNEYLDQQLVLPRLGARVLAGFSLTALVLAALGLYAVVAFAVGERAREVGIRMALGARGPHVVWMMMRGVMVTVGAGLAAGLLLALGAGQGLSRVLYKVSPTDPVTLAVVTAVLAVVAFVAACLPREACHARRPTCRASLSVITAAASGASQ
jgi:hypothetical protein